VVVQEVRRLQKEKKNNHIGYDVMSGEYRDMIKAGIIDPTKVTRGALENAASIAAMILTTEVLITDIPEKDKGAGMPPGGMGGMGGMGGLAGTAQGIGKVSHSACHAQSSHRIDGGQPLEVAGGPMMRVSSRRHRSMAWPRNRPPPPQRRPPARERCERWLQPPCPPTPPPRPLPAPAAAAASVGRSRPATSRRR